MEFEKSKVNEYFTYQSSDSQTLECINLASNIAKLKAVEAPGPGAVLWNRAED